MKFALSAFVAAIVVSLAPDPADAGPLARRRAERQVCTSSSCTTTQTVQTTQTVTTTTTSTALDEVNAKRAQRGLRPFLFDPLLTEAASRCAAFRAQHRLFGHTTNDFSFVPAGGQASSAGCAAYPASYGFMACCVYDNYTYAGAATVVGPDGRSYHHIFVR